MFTYKNIIKDILKKIKNNVYEENKKIPSEKALMIKYDVSRIVISRVIFELKKIGAIYSIPKKGNFVAQFFHGLIKPVQYEYNIDEIKDKEIKISPTNIFKKHNIYGEFRTIKRNYYRKKKLIIKSHIWIANNVKYIKNHSIINSIIKNNNLVSSIIINKFEFFEKKDKEKSLVNYRIIYSENGVLFVSKMNICKKNYISYKQEFII